MRFLRTSFLAVGLIALSSCASLDMERTSANGGTFRSSALAFTFLSLDFPAPALSTARGNVADTGRPELVVENELVFPYFGRLDWILDILCVRYARVTGTWGEPGEDR